MRNSRSNHISSIFTLDLDHVPNFILMWKKKTEKHEKHRTVSQKTKRWGTQTERQFRMGHNNNDLMHHQLKFDIGAVLKSGKLKQKQRIWLQKGLQIFHIFFSAFWEKKPDWLSFMTFYIYSQREQNQWMLSTGLSSTFYLPSQIN